MKKFAILVACAALATFAVGCDDEEENPPGGGEGGSGAGGNGGGGNGGNGGGVCGDSIIDAAAGEECDDGNTVAGDGCEADCTLPVVAAVCGNNTVEGLEKCDDGNTVDNDGCTADCLSKTIAISGQVALNPIVARWYFANGMATPSFENFKIRAVDPILSIAGDPNATLATAAVGADGSFSFAEEVKTATISLGMVLTVTDPEGTAVGSETIAASTMGVCQPGAPAPLPDCTIDIPSFTAYVVPLDFVRALETGVNGGNPLVSDTEGFVLGGVMDTNGEPIEGAAVTSTAADISYFDLGLQLLTTGATDASTGGFVAEPTANIANLAVVKAGTDFVSSSATVGKSAGVAFQIFFLHVAPAPGCGNGTVDAGEDCEPPGVGDCDAACHTVVVDVCGDSTVTGAEKCDDGNVADGDSCSADCLHKFISVSGLVSVNPLAGSIHQGAATPVPATTGLTLVAIEPLARLANPGDPSAGVVGMGQAAADGTFTMQVETTGVVIGLVVTVTDGDATTTDQWAQSTMGLCTAPCDVNLVNQPVYAVTDFANTVLEGSLATDLLNDSAGYILGMTLDVSGGAPAPAGGVSVAGLDAAGPVPDAEMIFLGVDAATGAFIDNGTEVTSPGIGAFLSTHPGITQYTASDANLTFAIPAQQAAASAGVIFQMFFIGQ